MKIQTGIPKENGAYIAFVQYLENPDFPYPEKKMLMYMEYTGWSYPSSDQNCRRKVLGWIGPIPCPTIEDLKNLDSLNFIYVVGTKEQAKKNQFISGPFNDLNHALEISGTKGEYICKNDAKTVRPLYKWSEKKSNWIKMKRKKSK